MVPQRPGVGATTAVFAVVIVVVVGVMGLISLASPSGGGAVSSSTSTTTEEQQTTFFSTVSSSGLQLQLKLNTTTIQSGSALMAQITLFNSLGENLSLHLPNLASNSTIATWNAYDFVCNGNSMWNLAGYALLNGHYSSENVSSAGEPLMLAPPVGLSCINNSRNLFVFLPNSSDALVSDSSETNQPATLWHAATNATTESCQYLSLSAAGSMECPVGASLFGYWSAPVSVLLDSRAATTSSSYFHYFSPGEYTLVVEDIWGETIYAHFQVTSALGRPVVVVSVTGPMPPLNPGGPIVSVTLRNVGDTAITSLNATLPINTQEPKLPYSFVFNVNSSDPLMPGRSVQETRTLINGGFDSSLQYALTINGALINGTQFSYTEQIQIVPPG